ncbi:MAG TPA: hypothetical protein P5191_14895 [Ruminococcus sp.]|nr:hypothetical protein [Ruminococcus sp.]
MSIIKAIYKNGYLFNTEPALSDYYEERDKFYEARFIISDGIEYDLEEIASVQSITVPDFKRQVDTETPGTYSLGVTGYLDYVLRMKASELRNKHKNELSIAVLAKACEIMKRSTVQWKRNDYMRLVNWLYEDKRFDEADQYEEKINAFFKLETASPKYTPTHSRQIQTILSLGYDLCMTSDHFGCCPECAKRRNRVFSISGNDKRFIKFEEYECACTGLSLLMFRENYDEHYLNAPNYIEYSNRPFIDDRTDEEKLRRQYYLDRITYESLLERDKKLFYKMQHFIPSFPFKSFNSYRRASKEKIKEYSETAKKYGFDILPAEEEEKAVDRYLKTKKEKGWR